MYQHGETEDKEAIMLLERAAARGDPPAIRKLAECYEVGAGVEQSIKQAKKYYKLAASMGDRQAKETLSVLYEGEDHSAGFTSAADVSEKRQRQKKTKPWTRGNRGRYRRP